MKNIRKPAAFLLLLVLTLTFAPAFGAMAAGSECLIAEIEKGESPKGITWTSTDEIVFASGSVNIRKGAGTGYDIIGKLAKGDAIHRIAVSKNWSSVEYRGHVRYVNNKYVTASYPYSTLHYPMRYYDKTSTITIEKELYAGTWCFTAHVEFTDFTRFFTDLALGKWANYGGSWTTEKPSHAADRLDALLVVNGDGNRTSGIVKHGVIYRNSNAFNAAGAYNAHTGRLFSAEAGTALYGESLSSLVAQRMITDSFNFAPGTSCLLYEGTVTQNGSTLRAQRTFIGTNCTSGDIWLVVSNGRFNDGESPGLTPSDCGRLLLSKGCRFGIALDGGASSAMVFLGRCLNAVAGNERQVLDFVVFR